MPADQERHQKKSAVLLAGSGLWEGFLIVVVAVQGWVDLNDSVE